MSIEWDVDSFDFDIGEKCYNEFLQLFAKKQRSTVANRVLNPIRDECMVHSTCKGCGGPERSWTERQKHPIQMIKDFYKQKEMSFKKRNRELDDLDNQILNVLDDYESAMIYVYHRDKYRALTNHTCTN